MSYPDANRDSEQETVKTGQSSSESEETINDWLRHLRARRYLQSDLFLASHPEAAEKYEAQGEAPADLAASHTETDTEADLKIDLGEGAGEEEKNDLAAAVDEMGQEVRRMGRELFKAHRATEQNQQLFTEAVDEIRRLASAVAQIPAQSDESLKELRFEAKAEMCRELLRMSDTIEASLSAADDLLERLEAKSPQNSRGFIFLFAAAGQMRQSLVESVEALRQWRDGQRLLATRLQAILQTAGVRAIESIGRQFDPALHRAVSTEQRDDIPSGMIVGEELKGYTLEGRILRYTEVIVAKNG